MSWWGLWVAATVGYLTEVIRRAGAGSKLPAGWALGRDQTNDNDILKMNDDILSTTLLHLNVVPLNGVGSDTRFPLLFSGLRAQVSPHIKYLSSSDRENGKVCSSPAALRAQRPPLGRLVTTASRRLSSRYSTSALDVKGEERCRKQRCERNSGDRTWYLGHGFWSCPSAVQSTIEGMSKRHQQRSFGEKFDGTRYTRPTFEFTCTM